MSSILVSTTITTPFISDFHHSSDEVWQLEADIGEHGEHLNIARADSVGSVVLGDAQADVSVFTPASAERGTEVPVSIAQLGFLSVGLDTAVADEGHQLVYFDLFVDFGGALAVGLGQDT